MALRWSTSRNRYEREGVLVEEAALRRAEEECLSDADLREARRLRAAEARGRVESRYVEEFARAIRARYPGCPPGIDREIAERACQTGSSRVGRTAAAKTLADEAVDLAVRAAIRHRSTDYDRYLMDGWDRDEARARVLPEVDAVFSRWRTPR